MNALALLVPRPQSRDSRSERAEADDFHALVESIETLLFTSADHPEVLDAAVLTEALAELEERWPDAAAELRPRVEARGRHRA
ncbi:hypothetical protein [Nocardioides sp. CER19]|uniref:hypothetical protein n=1 Tax=Nocardioides sp. CER19 TaxID=3038538 RepID=UPI00244B5C30|nr:hypothetical protein [Nocardioides sp. CER19]MDH2413148.1 hypothetical protein [Nocardioides sp. CER19]